MDATVQTLGLIVKATRQCNLRCEYCHDWRSRKDVMPFEILAEMTYRALRSKRTSRVEFIWHGGEPLLLGAEFYAKALSLQQEFSDQRHRVTNSLQTNGTLLDSNWCDFFKEANFSIGISVDGPPELHDLSRHFSSGKGSSRQVYRAVELLNEKELTFGILMVLGRRALEVGPHRIWRFFTEDLQVKRFSFLPARPDNTAKSGETPTSDYVNSREYVDFMKVIFDLWIESDDPLISIRELDSLLNGLLGGSVKVCTLAGQCIGQYYHVEASGDIYHCDKYLGDIDYMVGNILQDEFDDLYGSPRLVGLRKAEEENLRSLAACEFFQICNGGCPHDRYIAKRHQGEVADCCGLRGLIDHMRMRLGPAIVNFQRERNVQFLGPSIPVGPLGPEGE